MTRMFPIALVLLALATEASAQKAEWKPTRSPYAESIEVWNKKVGVCECRVSREIHGRISATLNASSRQRLKHRWYHFEWIIDPSVDGRLHLRVDSGNTRPEDFFKPDYFITQCGELPLKFALPQ